MTAVTLEKSVERMANGDSPHDARAHEGEQKRLGHITRWQVPSRSRVFENTSILGERHTFGVEVQERRHVGRRCVMRSQKLGDLVLGGQAQDQFVHCSREVFGAFCVYGAAPLEAFTSSAIVSSARGAPRRSRRFCRNWSKSE